MPTLKLSPISILISLSDEPDGRDSLFLSTFELMIMCLKSITGYSIKAFKDEKCKLKNETVLKIVRPKPGNEIRQRQLVKIRQMI